MTGKHHKSPQWTEQEVGKLLSQFFEAEMPAALKSLDDPQGVLPRLSVPVTVRSAPAHSAPGPARAGGLLVGATALCAVILMVATLPELSRSWLVSSADLAPVNLVPIDQPTMPVPLLSFSVDRFETELGTVEQRTQLTWQNVAAYEPESGTEVSWSIPELEIELYVDESPAVSLTATEQE